MLKEQFQLVIDRDKGMHYIIKSKDKNQKSQTEDITVAFMPEIKDSKYCPGLSYIKYADALSFKSDKL